MELLLGLVLMGVMLGLVGTWLQRWHIIDQSLELQRKHLEPMEAEVNRRIRARQTVADTLDDGRVILWTREHHPRWEKGVDH